MEHRPVEQRDDIKMGLIDAGFVHEIWPQIADGIDQGCHNSESMWTGDELREECEAGRCGLVLGTDNDEIIVASIWQVQDTGSHKRLACVMVWGRHLWKWIRPHERFAIQMAKHFGASRIRLEGRKAHRRILPRAKVVRMIYEQDVSDG